MDFLNFINDNINIDDDEKQKIIEAYGIILSKRDKVIQLGGKIPDLKSKMGLALIYLTMNINKVVNANDVYVFLSKCLNLPNSHTLVRQLWTKYGIYILGKEELGGNRFKLITLDELSPKYISAKRQSKPSREEFEELKKKYNYECVSCHCKEGEPHPNNPDYIVRLEMGHKDPNKNLTIDNCIPQCPYCNQTNRDDYVYNNKGGIEKINNINVLFKLLDYNNIKEFIKKAIEKYGDKILKD